MFFVQTMRRSGWETVCRTHDVEEAFDKADDMSRNLLYSKIRVFEPIMGATYYGPELKEIEIHGLKTRQGRGDESQRDRHQTANLASSSSTLPAAS